MKSRNEYRPQVVSHPGVTLSEKLKELEMGPKEFAVRTGKPEKTISAILHGHSAITPDMAVLFEDVLLIPAHFWMNRQRNFDEYISREKREANIKSSIEWAKQFPIAQMCKLGWIAAVRTHEEKVKTLFSFFGIGLHEAWEDYYLNNKLKVAFRISLAHTNDPYAISAWLRQGEIQAKAMQAASYQEATFKKSLHQIRQLMQKGEVHFFPELQALCLQSGVKLVRTSSLPKAPISGATRWLNDTPLIQISSRCERFDSFWFSFFHEAGHILLHGKKDIFLEEVQYDDKDQEKEKEADAFATQWTQTEMHREQWHQKLIFER